MYYVGYSRGLRVPYWQFEGLARSRDGGNSFQRVQRVPVIDRSDAEPQHRTSAFVRREADGRFRMWYVAGDEWIDVGGKPLPRYNLRCVESAERHPLARSRPGGAGLRKRGRARLRTALDRGGTAGSGSSTRSGRIPRKTTGSARRYRPTAGRGSDGTTEVGIDVGAPGDWDGGGIAYGSIFAHGDRTYLFYNGSARGRTGFGWAILDGTY